MDEPFNSLHAPKTADGGSAIAAVPESQSHAQDESGGADTQDESLEETHHTSQSGPDKHPIAMQKRRRVTRACDECRRKKIKCDGKQPCTHCTVYSYGKIPTSGCLSQNHRHVVVVELLN